MNRTEVNDESVAIQEELDENRADISETVGKIEERLSPARIKEQVAGLTESAVDTFEDATQRIKSDVQEEVHEIKTAVHDATVGKVDHMAHEARVRVTSATASMVDVIKANPVPIAMAALGLGWMLVNRRRNGRRNDYERVLQEAPEKAKRTFQHATHRAGMGARQVEARFERIRRENPFAIGVIALAAGAAAGLLLPHSRVEDEWMGSAKAKLLSRAEGVARTAIETAERSVNALTGAEEAATNEGENVTDEQQPGVH